MPSTPRGSIRDRVVAVFRGEKPDRIPFIDRLELWHKTHVRAGTLPDEFRDLSLTDIHRRVGIGQQKFMAAYGQRLVGVELIAKHTVRPAGAGRSPDDVRVLGRVVRHEVDPVVEYFPRMPGLAVQDQVGVTDIELTTPLGRLTMQYEMLPEMVAAGTEAYIKQHLVKSAADYPIVAYILERMEWVRQYDQIQAEEARLGDIGYVVPMMGRTPFQQFLLEYLGEVNAFYALHDDPGRGDSSPRHLLGLIDERIVEALHGMGGWPVLYVEFGDNLHGVITNPRLFREYCLPNYRRYADILRSQGKKMGSHTDGDVRSLLGLLAESGLDVAESFSPVPLTTCTNEEAWAAWPNGPLIWGGIPSPILEERFPAGEFRAYIARLLGGVGDRPFILGVGDQVMGNDLIERVRYVAEAVEARG
jgi:hypothetical protein